jgi:hypothetical protein
MKQPIGRKRAARNPRRSATGRRSANAIRLPAQLRKRVDRWAARQPDKPGRAEAIRHLLEAALAGLEPTGRRSRTATAQALRMAAREISSLADPSAPSEERIKRKRRLLKGPREFREMRKD